MSVADSLLPPSSKIASKASVTFARSSSEITLLSDPGASFLFVAPKTMSKRRGQSSIRVLKADTPVYEYGPNTWGTSEVDQKVSHTEQNPVVTD
jgi:hypothetical protein